MFEPERFFAFSRVETNISSRVYPDFEAFKEKFPRTDIRGEKIPKILDFHDLIVERFPNPRFVLIYRDAYRVCSSWNARGQDPKDPWPVQRDYRKAVRQINLRLRTMLDLALTAPGRYATVRYERIFDPESSAALEGLLAWLGVEAAPEILAAHKANGELLRRIAEKPLLLEPSQREYVERKVDWKVYDALDRIAV
jgi:hypothetical protein